MSKSRGAESGTVLLLDPPDVIARRSRAPSPTRQRGALRPGEKPGISNLIELLTVVTGESIPDVESR
jgi:hypothetical protein